MSQSSTPTPEREANEPLLVSPVTDALIIVDMQNDFLVDDAPLYVPGGLRLIPGINHVSEHFEFAHVTATRDWHPADHCSFQVNGGQWLVHGVRCTRGAQFHADLSTAGVHLILNKATRQDADSYSAFEDERGRTTGLAGLLRECGVRRVFVCGVALDFCVFCTAMSAREAGMNVVVLEDLCAATDDLMGAARRVALQAAGVTLRSSSELMAAA